MTDELKPCLAYPCDGHMKGNSYDVSLECSSCQFVVADDEEYAALVAGKQAAINDETQNPWKSAIINELIVDCIFTKEHETNPRKALGDAIEWNCQVALDPAVSKQARDLQQQAIDAVLLKIRQEIDREFDSGTHTTVSSFYDDCLDIVSVWEGDNPLVEAQTRIAELERELAEVRKDAERYRWLCADLFGEERIKRNGILCRMPVMSYSAASTDIDAAMRQEGE